MFSQAHSSVEKAGLIGLVKMRYIECDDNLSLRGDRLKEAIAHDREKGLIPFFVSCVVAPRSPIPNTALRNAKTKSK
jgi:glutamate/tyrosine decarboxylase-like PLP-dependent enzyme